MIRMTKLGAPNNGLLIVQRIRTEWTKNSRGGAAAGVRNTVPEALRLPSQGVGRGVLHDVHYRETDEFLCKETVRQIDLEESWELASLQLHSYSDQIAARFVWSWHGTGAPERKSHDAFVLRRGEWGRLKCNGRHSDADSGAWWYQQDVFNVAWMEALDPARFLNTIPNFNVAELARLR
jgi:hypothetical protein